MNSTIYDEDRRLMRVGQGCGYKMMGDVSPTRTQYDPSNERARGDTCTEQTRDDLLTTGGEKLTGDLSPTRTQDDPSTTD